MNKKTAIYRPDANSENASKPTSEQPNKPSVNAAQSQTTPQEATHNDVEARRQQIDQKVEAMPTEYGGRSKDKGLEPTRYNDWEFKGRCIDF